MDIRDVHKRHSMLSKIPKDIPSLMGVYTLLMTELLTYGYCHEFEEKEDDIHILPPLINIIITYCTQIRQFYFDPM